MLLYFSESWKYANQCATDWWGFRQGVTAFRKRNTPPVCYFESQKEYEGNLREHRSGSPWLDERCEFPSGSLMGLSSSLYFYVSWLSEHWISNYDSYWVGGKTTLRWLGNFGMVTFHSWQKNPCTKKKMLFCQSIHVLFISYSNFFFFWIYDHCIHRSPNTTWKLLSHIQK